MTQHFLYQSTNTGTYFTTPYKNYNILKNHSIKVLQHLLDTLLNYMTPKFSYTTFLYYPKNTATLLQHLENYLATSKLLLLTFLQHLLDTKKHNTAFIYYPKNTDTYFNTPLKIYIILKIIL
jgi:hypothetical protein